MKPLVYLACPYGHEYETVREDRFLAANRVAAKLMLAGHTVFSPLSHSVPIEATGLDAPHEFWMEQDMAILRKCDAVFVVLIDGWRESRGVQAEIAMAQEWGLVVKFVDEDGVVQGEHK